MENEHVLSALSRKRAEIGGEVERLAAQLDGLQADMACVDRAIRLFDPRVVPDAIRPIKKRNRPLSPRVFRHGDFSRGILAILRNAQAPMGSRDIAAALSDAHGLSTDAASIRGMTCRVRGMLERQRPDVVERVEGPEGVAWRAA
jgi:hypothetical protein